MCKRIVWFFFLLIVYRIECYEVLDGYLGKKICLIINCVLKCGMLKKVFLKNKVI